jgi:hypothetical protein
VFVNERGTGTGTEEGQDQHKRPAAVDAELVSKWVVGCVIGDKSSQALRLSFL